MHRRDPRREHSVLFDLDALARTQGDGDPFEAPPSPAAAPIAAVHCPPPPRRWVPILTTVALILAGSLALAAVGGATWHLMTRTQPTPPAPEPTRIAVGDPTPMPSSPVDQAAPSAIEGPTPTVADAPPAAPEAAPEAEAEAEARAEPEVAAPTPPRPTTRRAEPRRPRPTRTAQRAAAAEDRPETTPPPVAPAVAAQPKAEREALDDVDRMLRGLDADRPETPRPPDVVHTAVALPERLTRRQILHAVRRVGPRINQCGGEGTYRARLRITPAGRVERVTVTGGAPGARSCVERHVRGMSFPRFGGDAMSIELPFRM